MYLCKKFCAVFVFLLMTISTASADDVFLGEALAERFPDNKIESIKKLKDIDLYELIIDGDIYYSDSRLRYLIDGNVIEVETMKNITMERRRVIEEGELKAVQIAFNDLPLDWAVKKVLGDGSRKMAYFADPNCGFCKQFEINTLPLAKDVTVYIFPYPVISERSIPLAKAIWCAEDQGKAWDTYVFTGKSPENIDACDDPIDKIVEYGRSKKIRGTPTLFFADGSRVPGAIKLEQLEQFLSQTP